MIYNDEVINRIRVYGIKFACEQFANVPMDWSDEQIDMYVVKQRLYYSSVSVWCPYESQLCDDAYINKEYMEKPIPQGMRRIRCAHEDHRYIGWLLDRDNLDEEIAKYLLHCGKSIIQSVVWCVGDEELFKDNNMSRRILKREQVDQPTKEEIEKKNREAERELYINADHPNAIENDVATFGWVGLMIVSILFKWGLILCLLETIIWWSFINRKTRRAKEWDEKHK